MRAAISLLVSSLVCGSLAFNCKAVQTHFSALSTAKSDYQLSSLLDQDFHLADKIQTQPPSARKAQSSSR